MATVTFKGREFTVRAEYVAELEAIFAMARRGAAAPEEVAVGGAGGGDRGGVAELRPEALGRMLVNTGVRMTRAGRGLCAVGQPHEGAWGEVDLGALKGEVMRVVASLPPEEV